MPSTQKKITGKISAKGRGWAFSYKDFATYAQRATIDWVLYNLKEKGIIRGVIRGIFDYPRFSERLNRQLPPDIDQVARAIARKFNWQIEPSGSVALNILGLSTQVPGKYIYRSSGSNRSYNIGNTLLNFQKTKSKDIGFRYYESGLIVQALKALGKEPIDSQVLSKIRYWLDPDLRRKVLADTTGVTGWVRRAIHEICSEDQSE